MAAFGVLGAGGQARETVDYARPDAAAFFAVDAEFVPSDTDEVVALDRVSDAQRALPVVAAVGAPGLRRSLVEHWGDGLFRSVVASSAWVAASAQIGAGSILAPQSAVSADAVIGGHVLLNIGASVSHDSRIGSFATLSPGVRVGGDCRIGDGVFLGIGATVSHGVSIESGIVVGAGAVVLGHLVEPGVYVGVPARRLRDQEGWLRVL